MKARFFLAGLAVALATAGAGAVARHRGLESGLLPRAPWEQAAPSDALTVVALGGMRGPYVGYLWYKSSLLFVGDRENLRKLPLYYGPMGTLQPQFAEMWSATASNLAFDAAAKFRDTPEQAWPWIHSGAERLREGIRRNPTTRLYRLHFDLAWIYLEVHAGDRPDPRRRFGAGWRSTPGARTPSGWRSGVSEAAVPGRLPATGS